MRRILLASLVSLSVVHAAVAQVATPMAPTTPVVATPTVASPAAVVPMPSGAAATTQQPDLTQQMQKLMGNKNTQQSLGQMMVVGTLLGCTQKQAGKDATQAFYKQMQDIAKTAEGYCKQGNAAEARALVLSTIQQHHNDPVVKSLLVCYENQRMNLAGMAGQKMADDMEHYARWIRDPSLMPKEMKESDICKNVKVN